MWTHFADTKETVPTGMGFSLFGAVHIAELLAAVLILAGGVCLYRRCSAAGRRRFRWAVAAALLADEAVKVVGLMLLGRWLVAYLPLHLCSLCLYAEVWHAFFPRRVIAEGIYALALPAAALALLMPVWTPLPVFNFMHLHSLTVHILILLYPLLLLADGFHPDARRLRWVAVVLAGVCVVIYPLNRVLGTDFLFLGGAVGTPLAALARAIGGWYVLLLPPIAAAIWAVLYLPWKKKR